MLASRGQENLIRARPTNGKALPPKTPSNLQTPRTNNRAPLGAKTTNAKAQTALRDKNATKLQVFKTPAPGQQQNKQENPTNRQSTARKSARSKITVPPPEQSSADILTHDTNDDEPDFGYAPPPPVELPDHPFEFGYDQSFQQFRPENMFRGYGEIYDSSPKDENGLSIRVKREEEEYRQYRKQQEQQLLERIQEEFSKPLVISDDEFDIPRKRIVESKPSTTTAKLAASALSSIRIPSVATKQTASSRLKMSEPTRTKESSQQNRFGVTSRPKPLSVSRNTIGFPKARKAPSIIPKQDCSRPKKTTDAESFADEFSDFEALSPAIDSDDEDFQLPMPE